MNARVLCCLCVLTAASSARAQLEVGADEARVFSIQERPYRLGHEFQLGVGVLPLDAFYTGMVLGASYTYHFTDFWAWEIAGGGFSINLDTSLEDDLLEQYQLAPEFEGGGRPRWLLTSHLVIKPLFGKLAVFNHDVVYSETFFALGGGPVRMGELTHFALTPGVGMRFWAGEHVSVRFDVRHHVVFVGGGSVENLLMFMFSGAISVPDTPVQTKRGEAGDAG